MNIPPVSGCLVNMNRPFVFLMRKAFVGGRHRLGYLSYCAVMIAIAGSPTENATGVFVDTRDFLSS